MTRSFEAVVLSLAFFVLIAAITWLAVPVLCLGDAKFDGGCGQMELYLLSGAVYAPVGVAVIVIALTSPIRRARQRLVASAGLGALLATYAVSYVLPSELGAAITWGLLLACLGGTIALRRREGALAA